MTIAHPERRGDAGAGLTAAVVESVEPDGDSAILTLAPPPGSDGYLTHRAGQHAGLRPAGFPLARPYSFVDTGDGKVKFLVGGDGPVSTHIRLNLQAGDTVWLSEASGTFTFVTPHSPDVVFVAGGVGIAPVIGLARAALGAGNTTTLVCANRSHTYLDGDLRRLESDFPAVRVLRVMSRPYDSWRGPRGRLTSGLVAALLNEAGRTGKSADWYICGSPGFSDNARAIAQALGVRRLHEEPFIAALDPPEPPDFEATVSFVSRQAGRAVPRGADEGVPAGRGEESPGGGAGRAVVRTVTARRGQVIAVPPGRTILEAALDAGIEIPRSCMSGTCRECECIVEAGSAVQAAVPATAEVGDAVRTCVAYPAAAEGLVLMRENSDPEVKLPE